MSTCSLTGTGKISWFGRTSRSRRVHVGMTSISEAAPKSMLSHAPAKQLGVRQRALEL